MAQDLALIAHGEPQWDTKVNAAIEKVNTELGGTNLSLSDPSTLGIVTYNGITVGEGYYVLKTADRTLVFTQ